MLNLGLYAAMQGVSVMGGGRYECEEPPCVHVVVDYPRKRFAVFIETGDGEVLYVPFDRLRRAVEEAGELLRRRFREAQGDEVDELAAEYLGAEPLEDEVEG